MAANEKLPILILNTGSATFKWALLSDDERFLGTGAEEWTAEDALTRKAQIVAKLRSLPPCRAVGHRIVHGGSMFRDSVIVDDAVRQELDELLTLDLLHMRPALCALDAARDTFPDATQVAAFDTAFHHTMSEVASSYALPRDWVQRWQLRRFGFHGLSVTWSVDWLRRNAGNFPARAIVAHLGSGCSVTALDGGESVDTSMGFTPLEGMMMATRSGSLDPGLILHLQTHHNVTALDMQDVLTHQSGLLGVSGISADIRDVLAAADRGDANARLAYELFILTARRAVGAAAGVLGGADAIVFTGGVGEHQPRVRRDIAGALEGLTIDDAANEAGQEGLISRPGRVSAFVVHSREDIVLLREVLRLTADAGTS